MKRILLVLVVLALAAGAVVWILTAPKPLAAAALPAHKADPANGERVFWTGGCASCHAAKGAKDADRLKLGGGQAFATPFGTFYAPNISPDPVAGIGRWSELDLVNAMQRGVSPEGRHYYPAFPYGSYVRMKTEDVVDLAAFLKSLPAVSEPSKPHDLPFPFNIRRGLGLWKLLYLDPAPVTALAPDAPAEIQRGRHIVEGAGHCGECHTPRNAIGGPDRSRWLAGAKALEGDGKIPNITPDTSALGGWSAKDIAYYLESGLTPDGDSVGGPMATVVDNMAKLPAEDRNAIAAYLKAVPPRPKQ
ncbi:c-type cytochrome [Prosthecomicrobium sp. N25]|uniref:c-type cytochrome n=1 Tax=Prosthecomicrobium sp. N25 TaxID=3129254 RepID=UPI0030780B8F